MLRVIAMLLAGALLLAPLASFADSAEEEDLTARVRAWWQATGELAGDLAAEAGEQIASGLDSAREALQGAVDEAESYLRGSIPAWGEEVRQAWETLLDSAREAGAQASEDARKAYEDLRAWAAEHSDAAREGLEALIDELGRAAGIPEAEDAARRRQVEGFLSELGWAELSAAWETVRAELDAEGSVPQEELDAALDKLHLTLIAFSRSEAFAAQQALDALTLPLLWRGADAYIRENGDEAALAAWENVQAALESDEAVPAEDADLLRSWLLDAATQEASSALWRLEALLAGQD